MNNWGFILATLLLGSLNLVAEPAAGDACLRILTKAGESKRANASFWSQKALKMGRGNDAVPILFGFDAELWHVSDMLKLVASHPESLAAAREILEEKDQTASARLGFDHGQVTTQFTKTELKKWLGVSSTAKVTAQLREDAKAKRKFTLLDLKPEMWKHLRHGSEEKSQYAALLQESVQLALHKRALNIEADFEGTSGSSNQGPLGNGEAIELKMSEPILTRHAFSRFIKGFLHKELDYPETHFHISVPSEKVSPREMILAARALEMKITLEELVAELDYDGSLAPYDKSALAHPLPKLNGIAGDVERGVVRIDFDRWDDPIRAHDVEIRQWLDADHALDNIRFLNRLLQSRARLRNTDDFKGTYIAKLVPANLHNSLNYAAWVLEDRLPADKQHIVAKLRELGGRATDAQLENLSLRKEIAAYLKEANVLSYITADTFLGPTVRGTP